ncbi:MAG: SDR family oxidoreductase [Pseudomonadota bacterium]
MPSVLITGANRGIGLEFARQYAADGWKVQACCRKPETAGDLRTLAGDIHVHQLDVTDHAALRQLGEAIGGPIDLVIANAGKGTRGEGDFGAYDYDVWRAFLEVNLYGAVATAEAFAAPLKKAKGKIAFISSKMGSIGDASGGAMAYRTSKTALNMAAKVVADAFSSSGVAVGVFHPGWVETDMGGPNALITPQVSVAGMRRLLVDMPVTSSPKFLAYDGKEIPW